VGGQRFQFGAEQEPPPVVAPVERLDAEAVAHQGEAPGLTVPQREGEHPEKARQQRLQPPFGGALDDGLGIGVAAEDPSTGDKLGAQFGGVVDFAIVGEHHAATGRDHRLMPGRAEVDDRQAAVAQRDAGLVVGPDIAAIRATMDQPVGHHPGDAAEIAGGLWLKNSGNSAHRPASGFRRDRCRCASAKVTIDVEVAPGDLLDRKRALGQRSAGDTHLKAGLPVFDQAADRAGQRRAIASRHQTAGLVRPDGIAATGHIGGHHRPAASAPMASRQPGTSVVTTGRPLAAASISTFGKPSR